MVPGLRVAEMLCLLCTCFDASVKVFWSLYFSVVALVKSTGIASAVMVNTCNHMRRVQLP